MNQIGNLKHISYGVRFRLQTICNVGLYNCTSQDCLLYEETNAMEQSSSWEPNSGSAVWKYPSLVWQSRFISMFTNTCTGSYPEPSESSSHPHTLLHLPIHNTVFESHPWRESQLDCLGNIVTVLSVRYVLRQKKKLSIERIIEHIIQYSSICWSMLLDMNNFTWRLRKGRTRNNVNIYVRGTHYQGEVLSDDRIFTKQYCNKMVLSQLKWNVMLCHDVCVCISVLQ